MLLEDPNSSVITEHKGNEYHTDSWVDHHKEGRKRNSLENLRYIKDKHYIKERGWEIERTYHKSFQTAEEKHSYEPHLGFFDMVKYQNRIFADTFKIATTESNRFDLYTSTYVRDFQRKAGAIRVPGVDTGIFVTGQAARARAMSIDREMAAVNDRYHAPKRVEA